MDGGRHRGGGARAAELVVFVAAYVLLAVWGEATAGSADVTLWYPPPGLAAAAVVLAGARYVPAAIISELLVSLLVFDVAGDFGVGLTMLNAVVVGGGYAAVGLVLRRLRVDASIPDLRNLGLLAAVLIVGALPGALAGTTIQRAAGVLDGADHLEVFRTWYQGDAIGLLTIAPALVLGVAMRERGTSLAPRPSLRSPKGALEVLAVIAVPIATAAVIERVDVLYLSLAPIVLVALRRAHPGSAIAAAAVAGLVATTLTVVGDSFDRGDVVVLLAVIGLTGLLMGLLVAQRFRATQANVRLGHALAATDDLVVVSDCDGQPTWWNEAADPFILRDGAVPSAVGHALLGGVARAGELTRRAIRGDGWSGEEVLVDRDGREVPVSLVIIPELDEDDDVCAFTLFARDVSAQRAFEDELTRRALYDRLTGTANRALLLEQIGQATARATEARRAGAVMLLDIDRFKVVNETFGPGVGDELLCRVAERLALVLRRSDLLARPGGDEFAIVVEDRDGSAAVATLAGQVLAAFDAGFRVGEHELAVTASVGIVDLEPVDAEELLRRADMAMYQAKERGGGQFAVYQDDLSAAATRRSAIEATVRALIAADEVTLHHQPVVGVADGQVRFAEALLRVEVDGIGPVPPPEVIAVAVDAGLLHALGRTILRTAARDSVERTGACTSVNVSPVQLRDDRFPDDVANALAETGLTPDCLLLEVTEESFLDDLDQAVRVLDACRALGVRIALDDFGSGFSSLSVLRALPIDLLKIDQQLLAGVVDSPDARAIVRAVTSVAAALDLEVVAEGIEDHDQLHACGELGCTLAQGWLIGRPAPAAPLDVQLGPAPR